MSSRRGRSVGGQSSLGYLFGSDNEKTSAPSHDPPRILINFPPYGTDHDVPVTARPAPATASPSLIFAPPYLSNNYHRAHGQNSGNFITDRPSTKVKSVPGGDSSLGYLFGDNK